MAALAGNANLAAAQSPPPLVIPEGGPPSPDPSETPFHGWLLRGALDSVVQSSNNYLLTSPSQLSGWAVGVSPHASALWSNGIHTTELFGTYEHLEFRTLRTDDGEVTIKETYAPLRDLTFSLLGDYTHQTITSNLTSSIPGPITTVGNTVLPNGNTVLPNGTIVSPNGQIVGQVGQGQNASGLSAVNPNDQYTATLRADKIFNGGILSLSGSVLRTTYEEEGSRSADFTAKTFNEDAAFWMGPLLYAYSDGSYTLRTNTDPNPDSSAYRAIVGVGTDEIGFVRASAYTGYQGSQAKGSGSAGGFVYGGALSYYPALNWNLSLNFDETRNVSSAGFTSTQALSLPNPTLAQVALGASSDISGITFRAQYRPADQWTVSGLFGYTSIRYLDSPIRDNSWLADATVQYEMSRNFTLTWEYQYANILSNAPGSSAKRNLGLMRASYQF